MLYYVSTLEKTLKNLVQTDFLVSNHNLGAKFFSIFYVCTIDVQYGNTGCGTRFLIRTGFWLKYIKISTVVIS